MDPFAKLPAEIILLILKSCCKFTSLDGLQQISPWVEQVFNTSYKTVTERLLTNCSFTLEGLHNEFTLLATIASTTFTPTAMLEQLDSFREDRAACFHFHHQLISCSTPGCDYSGKSPSYCLRLPPAFFDSSLVSKPRCPIASPNDGFEWLRRRLEELNSEIYQFRIDSPPWIESYRMHHGLWNLELFGHIYNAT